MYSQKFNYFHGIMFHHFHDGKIHKSGQGSISKEDFINIINYIGRKNIINADEFYLKSIENKLNENEVCLTFDDGIKCQHDIALPVLDDQKIKAFFFVYSSLFDGSPDLLEVYRYFRINYFSNIDEFYNFFFSMIDSDLDKFFLKNNCTISNNSKKFPHYSINDVKFRLVRDMLLTSQEYELLMFKIFDKYEFDPELYYKRLFMSIEDLKNIDSNEHIIGLHSHSHPTLMENLTFNEQYTEYNKNRDVLSEILKKDKSDFKCMSHPCGSYNEDTKSVLNELGVKLGFKQIMTLEKEKKMKKLNNSSVEIARQDHADIMSMMQK